MHIILEGLSTGARTLSEDRSCFAPFLFAPFATRSMRHDALVSWTTSPTTSPMKKSLPKANLPKRCPLLILALVRFHGAVPLFLCLLHLTLRGRGRYLNIFLMDLPTISISDLAPSCLSLVRTGMPASCSATHSLANLPDWMSFRMSPMFS